MIDGQVVVEVLQNGIERISPAGDVVSGVDLSGRKFRLLSIGATWVDCDFSGCVLEDPPWGSGRSRSVFAGCKFDGAVIRNPGGYVRFANCSFENVRISSWRGNQVDLVDCVFSGTLKTGYFCHVPLPDPLFPHWVPNEVVGNDFSRAKLVDWEFRGGVDLERQVLPSGPDYFYFPDAEAAQVCGERIAAQWEDPVQRDRLLFWMTLAQAAIDGGQRQRLERPKDLPRSQWVWRTEFWERVRDCVGG